MFEGSPMDSGQRVEVEAGFDIHMRDSRGQSSGHVSQMGKLSFEKVFNINMTNKDYRLPQWYADTQSDPP
jgi:hypothetical protein